MAYQIDQCYATDQYGGFTDLPVEGGGTGFFRLGQIGDRWTFVSPEGNAFLYKGIMVWSVTGPRVEATLNRKYGFARTAYAPYALQRFAKACGINMIGWGTQGLYFFPENFLGQGRTVEIYGCGFPMLPNHGAALTAVTQRFQAKDLLRSGNDGMGVKQAAWPSSLNALRREMVDMGDPHFGPVAGVPELQITTTMEAVIAKRKGEFSAIDIAQSPWLHSNSPDDADYFFGHKGGMSIHPGWVLAITSPYQTQYLNNTATGLYDDQGGRTDAVVYGKQIARNFLQQKYGSIQALNSAWGSTYTTFDSSNPSDPLSSWNAGTGTGFLDEDGVTHAWIKMASVGTWRVHDMADLRSLPVTVKADLDAIMEVAVETLYRQYAIEFRRQYPNHLLAGPSALKHTLGFYKPGVLRAAGRVFDYLHMDYTPARPGGSVYQDAPLNLHPTADAPADLIRSYNLAGKPILAWYAALAHPESAAERQSGGFWASGGQQESRSRSTQVSKGALFGDNLELMLTSVGGDGKKFWLGFDNWNPYDQHQESLNWGLITENDNTYDGKQTQPFGIVSSPGRRHVGLANRHMITDETGRPTTRWTAATDIVLTERARYGDAMTLIRAGTRRAEFHWLSLVAGTSPPQTGRTVRYGGRTRIGGRIT
jgi:hypothetical protein